MSVYAAGDQLHSHTGTRKELVRVTHGGSERARQ